MSDLDAKLAANFVGEFLMHRHRGVLDFHDKIIVFGNDGHSKDERSQHEAEIVRNAAKAKGLESAFAVDDRDGYSWALVIENYGRQSLAEPFHKIVIHAWAKACGHKQ